MDADEKIKKLAGEWARGFETGERSDGGRFWRLYENAPEALCESIGEIHGTDILPDDFRFHASWIALLAIADGAIEDWHPEPDVYTADLLNYLGGPGGRVERANEALEEGLTTTIQDAAGWAQVEERREVHARAVKALRAIVEADDDGDDEEG